MIPRQLSVRVVGAGLDQLSAPTAPAAVAVLTVGAPNNWPRP